MIKFFGVESLDIGMGRYDNLFHTNIEANIISDYSINLENFNEEIMKYLMQKYINNVAIKNGARVLTPLVGGLVTVTAIDGSPVDIFDANGGLPRTSDLLTDINGAFSFYAADGRYTISLDYGEATRLHILQLLEAQLVIVDQKIVDQQVQVDAADASEAASVVVAACDSS